MEYIYEQLDRLTLQYPPDSIRLEFPSEGSMYQHAQETIASAFWLHYGRMVISVQCGNGNYCDFYKFASESSFRYNHPNTTTCEVAIFDNTVYSIRNHGWVIPDPEENPYQRVFPYADNAQLEDIVRTIYDYTN